VAGGGIEVLAGTMTGTVRMNAYPQELERKSILPRGK